MTQNSLQMIVSLLPLLKSLSTTFSLPSCKSSETLLQIIESTSQATSPSSSFTVTIRGSNFALLQQIFTDRVNLVGCSLRTQAYVSSSVRSSSTTILSMMRFYSRSASQHDLSRLSGHGRLFLTSFPIHYSRGASLTILQSSS